MEILKDRKNRKRQIEKEEKGDALAPFLLCCLPFRDVDVGKRVKCATFVTTFTTHFFRKAIDKKDWLKKEHRNKRFFF